MSGKSRKIELAPYPLQLEPELKTCEVNQRNLCPSNSGKSRSQ
jgi:hypothetical protein